MPKPITTAKLSLEGDEVPSSTDEKRYEYNHRYYWKNRKRIIQRNMKYTRIKRENKPVDKDKPFLTTITIY